MEERKDMTTLCVPVSRMGRDVNTLCVPVSYEGSGFHASAAYCVHNALLDYVKYNEYFRCFGIIPDTQHVMHDIT